MANLKHAQRAEWMRAFGFSAASSRCWRCFDLFVWATLWNVPNPLSGVLLASPPAETMPLPRALFIEPKHGYPGGMTGNSR